MPGVYTSIAICIACFVFMLIRLRRNQQALEMALVTYARRFPVRRGKLRVINRLWRTAARGRARLEPPA
jgi:hypothetical protein